MKIKVRIPITGCVYKTYNITPDDLFEYLKEDIENNSIEGEDLLDWDMHDVINDYINTDHDTFPDPENLEELEQDIEIDSYDSWTIEDYDDCALACFIDKLIKKIDDYRHNHCSQ